MASENLNNPAGRLHALLTQLYLRGQQPGAQNATAWDALASILSPGDAPLSASFMQSFTTVLCLPTQVRTAVAALDLEQEDKEDLLEHLDEIEKALNAVTSRSHNLGQTLSIFAPNGEVPRSAAMKSLSTCSRALSRHAAEPTLSNEALAAITEAVQDLMREIIEAEIDPAVKLQLLPHLRALLAAIQNVRVGGVTPIEVATDALAGAVMRRPTILTYLKKVPQLLTKTVALFTTVNAALSTEQQAQQDAQELAHHIVKMLTS
jgi:hypothetical protein